MIEAQAAAQAVRTRPPILALPSEDEQVLDALFGDWERLARTEHSMPPVSPLTFKLLRVDRDAPLAVAEVTEIVESDPILTARLLGLANSAIHMRGGKPITDVKSSIIRLGLYNAFEATFTQLFGLWVRHASRIPDDSLLDTLWLEYLITAFCAREIASALDDPEADSGISYTALRWAEPMGLGRFIQADYCRGTPLYAKFVEAHTRLGESLLKGWNAPERLAKVAATHHQPFARHDSPVTSIVQIADHLHEEVLAHELSDFRAPEDYPMGCSGEVPETVSAALAALGLHHRIDSIVERVARQSARIEQLARLPS
jgi:HD-like signal output (HDOD) protein